MDVVSGMSNSLLELLPRASVALVPLASGVGLDDGPLALAITRVGREIITIPVGRSPAIIRSTTRCEGGIIMGSELTLIRGEVTRAWRRLLPERSNVHVGPAYGITDYPGMLLHVPVDDDLFDHTRLFVHDELLVGLSHLDRALFEGRQVALRRRPITPTTPARPPDPADAGPVHVGAGRWRRRLVEPARPARPPWRARHRGHPPLAGGACPD